jgi:uncharacterized repeat protein (TIGR02543 family)
MDQDNRPYSGSIIGSTFRTFTLESDRILPVPTRPGHRFDGWFTNPQCIGDPIDVIIIGMFASDITLFALWAPGIFNITYRNVGGPLIGVLGQDSPTTHIFGTITTLVPAQRHGHTFAGWHRFANGTGLLTEISGPDFTHDIILYARWVIFPYTAKLQELIIIAEEVMPLRHELSDELRIELEEAVQQALDVLQDIDSTALDYQEAYYRLFDALQRAIEELNIELVSQAELDELDKLIYVLQRLINYGTDEDRMAELEELLAEAIRIRENPLTTSNRVRTFIDTTYELPTVRGLIYYHLYNLHTLIQSLYHTLTPELRAIIDDAFTHAGDAVLNPHNFNGRQLWEAYDDLRNLWDLHFTPSSPSNNIHPAIIIIICLLFLLLLLLLFLFIKKRKKEEEEVTSD